MTAPIALEIARVRYLVHGLHEPWLRGWETRFLHHLVPVDAAAAVQVTLHEQPSLTVAQPEGTEWPGVRGVRRDDGSLCFERRNERIEIDASLAHVDATFQSVGRTADEGPALPMPSESCLRVHQSLWHAQHGGLLLHASGYADERGALCFLGQSGEGKTTLARKLPQDGVLGDDQVALTLEQGVWSAHSTPFVGLWGRAPRRLSGPLRALVFLRKAPEAALRPLAARDAHRRLLTCAPWFLRVPARSDRWLERIDALARGVRAFELSLPVEHSPEPWLARLLDG